MNSFLDRVEEVVGDPITLGYVVWTLGFMAGTGLVLAVVSALKLGASRRGRKRC